MSYSYNTPLVVNPLTIRQGASNSKQARREIKRHQAIVLARFKTETAIKEHELNALRNQQTLYSFSEFYISRALTHAIRCAGTKDPNHDRLTSHAKRYWQFYTTEESTAPYEEGFTQDVYPIAGHIGSLAHQVVFAPKEFNTQSKSTVLLDMLLQSFWNELDMDLKSSPRRRMFALLKRVGWNKNYYLELEGLLKLAYEQRNPVFFQYFLGLDSFDNLDRRVLLGEIDDKLVRLSHELSGRRPIAGMPYGLISVTLNETLKIGRSGGFPLIFLSYAVEGLLQAIKTIQRLPDNIQKISLSSLIASQRVPELFYLLAESLGLVADAFAYLTAFNTHSDARDYYKQYLLESERWLAAAGINELSLASENRLGAL